MYPIKQSTAITVPFFVHDVSGDAVTGLTDGTFTKRISKNGAAFGAMTVTITELENGWYSIPLSAVHSDTLGLLTIVFTNAGAKQVNLQFRVTAKLIDDLNDVAATDIVSAGAITTLAGAVVNVDTVDSLTANADKTGYALSAAGVDAIWDETQAGHTTAGTFGRFLDAQVANVEADTQDIQSRLPAALVGGRMDSDVAVLQVGVIAAASFAAGAIDAAALNADAATEIADTLLNRDMSAVTVTNSRSPINAFRFLRNKWSIAAATLTVTEEDDITTAWTAALTTDGAANPITASDPA